MLTAVGAVYVELARAISARESVLIICRDDAHRASIERQLAEAACNTDRIHCYCVPANDTWVRDYGPLSLQQNGTITLHDYMFNAWGDKYTADLDDAVTGALCNAGAFGDTPCERQPLVLEGGSIDVDGTGSMLTTTRCLLSGTRNPGYDRAGLENWFRDKLGIERTLWLEHGELAGDDTDAHVDMLARFCDPATIAYSSCTDPGDVHYRPLSAMEQELRALRTRDGSPYHLVPLPIPAPIYNASGQRLPGSYANFLIINAAVLVPVYGVAADAQALQSLAGCFPDRTIVPVNCRPLIEQYGSLHCATMQLAAGVLPDPDT